MGDADRAEGARTRRVMRIVEATGKLQDALVAKRMLEGRWRRAANVTSVARIRYRRHRTHANHEKFFQAQKRFDELVAPMTKVDRELARARRWLDTLLLRAK